MDFGQADGHSRALQAGLPRSDQARRRWVEAFFSFFWGEADVFSRYPSLVFQQALNSAIGSAPQQAAAAVAPHAGPGRPWLESKAECPARRSTGSISFTSSGYVRDAAISADRGIIAVAGDDDKPVTLYSLENAGKELLVLPGTEMSWAVDFSPADPGIACGLGNPCCENVQLFDAQTGDRIWKTEPFPLSVYCLEFTENGEFIAVAGDAGELAVLCAKDGRVLAKVDLGVGEIQCLALSPRDDSIAVGNTHSVFAVYKMPWLETLLFVKGETTATKSVLFLSESRIALGTSVKDLSKPVLHCPGEIQIWDVPSRTPAARLRGHSQIITALVHCRERNELLSFSGADCIRWDLATGGIRAHVHLEEPLSPSKCMGMTVYVREHRQVCVEPVSPSERSSSLPKKDIPVELGRVEAAAINATGERFAVMSWSREGCRMDDIGARVAAFRSGPVRPEPWILDSWQGTVFEVSMACSFSPDGRYFIYAMPDKHIRGYDFGTGRRIFCLPTSDSVRRIRFSRRPDILLCCVGSATIGRPELQLVDYRNGSVINRIGENAGLKHWVEDADVADSGTLFLLDFRGLYLADAGGAPPLRPVEGNWLGAKICRCTASGSLLAVASEIGSGDRTKIVVFEMARRPEPLWQRELDEEVRDVAFVHLDELVMVTGATTGILWFRARSGEIYHCLPWPEGGGGTATVSRLGKDLFVLNRLVHLFSYHFGGAWPNL